MRGYLIESILPMELDFVFMFYVVFKKVISLKFGKTLVYNNGAWNFRQIDSLAANIRHYNL